MEELNSVDYFSKDNKEFNDLLKDLKSKKVWMTYEFQESESSFLSRDNFFLLYVDNKLHVIHSDYSVYSCPISRIQINPPNMGLHHFIPLGSSGTFFVNQDQKETFDDYLMNLQAKEAEFVEWIEKEATKLLEDDYTNTILMKFLENYLEHFYIEIGNSIYLEDDLLSFIFSREKKEQFEITHNPKNEVMDQTEKLVDLFSKRELFIPTGMMNIDFSGLLIINMALERLSLGHFTNLFIDSYGGYFTSIKEKNLKECIVNYFDIDFIEHTEHKNISLLTYYLYSETTFLKENSNDSITKALEIITDKVNAYDNEKELNLFEKELMGANERLTENELSNLTIGDVDLLNGSEFEDFISFLFKKLGYTVIATPKSGDQGIDVVVVKNGLRIGIQTKRYASKVSNKAIQEVVAGTKHYGLQKSIVITNNFFTDSAVELALSNDVILWDRNILERKLKDVKHN